MTMTPEAAALAEQLKRLADARMDRGLDAVTAAWLTAWDESAQAWHEALDDLAVLADGDTWPTRAQIQRSIKAQKALADTAVQLQRAIDAGSAAVTGDLDDLVRLAAEQHQQMLAAQLPAGYALPPVRYDATATALMVQRTTQQITSQMWPIAPEAEAAMRSALIRGTIVGKNPRDAADEMLTRLGGIFDGGRYRAENIMRTEMIDVMRTASRQAQLPHSDVLRGWRWTAGLDSRVCPACLSLHGAEFPLDEPGPLGHPSCRCVRTPVTKSWAELGFTDVPEPDLSAKTGPEWFDEQPPRVQRRLLGRKRYNAWLDGDYPPEQWAVLRQNPSWRPSYGVSPVPA